MDWIEWYCSLSAQTQSIANHHNGRPQWDYIYVDRFEREKGTTIFSGTRCYLLERWSQWMEKLGSVYRIYLLLILYPYNDKPNGGTSTQTHTPHKQKPKRIESIMYTHTSIVSLHWCVRVMLCTQNHRFVWIANINDASVYLDLSLLTNKFAVKIRCFASSVLRYTNERIEANILRRPNKQTNNVEKRNNRKFHINLIRIEIEPKKSKQNTHTHFIRIIESPVNYRRICLAWDYFFCVGAIEFATVWDEHWKSIRRATQVSAR